MQGLSSEIAEATISRFSCTECGDCCRRHRVPLTVFDLSRLQGATNEPASELIEWLSPSHIDMTGEPESFVVLPEGRRLPVLAFRDGACRFLDAKNRCSAYGARPASCRTFPLEVTLDPMGVRRLVILEDAACPGRFDAPPSESVIFAQHSSRQSELLRHVHMVGAWNRLQRLRKLSGHRLEPAKSFVQFALLKAVCP